MSKGRAMRSMCKPTPSAVRLGEVQGSSDGVRVELNELLILRGQRPSLYSPGTTAGRFLVGVTGEGLRNGNKRDAP